MIAFLDIIIVIGVIIGVGLGITIIKKIQNSTNSNHQDTINTVKQLKKSNDLDNRIIICMLKVPIAQRTDNLEENCRRTITQTQPTGNTPTPTPIGSAVSPPKVLQALVPKPQNQQPIQPASSSPSPAPSSPPASPPPTPVVPVPKLPLPSILKQVLNFLGL